MDFGNVSTQRNIFSDQRIYSSHIVKELEDHCYVKQIPKVSLCGVEHFDKRGRMRFKMFIYQG